ncbi:MAG: DUF4249 family protein [Ferruginibacter sp.]
MKWFLAFLLFLGITSCEKNINFKLKNAPDVLVVDATIENNQAPVVILTKSLDFFSTVNPAQLLGSFVRNADVFLSNGTLNHKLKEYAIPIGAGLNLYYYSIDSANLSTAFNGALNTNYQLKIIVDQQEYTATTTIPTLSKKIDSVWWKPAPFATDTTEVLLMGKFTDPPGLGNYVRYFTKKNREPFLPGENSVFDDQVIENTTYSLQIDPGIDRNNPIPRDSNFFRRGDTLTLKISNINKATYTFWSTWEFAYQSIGNPFAQPNKVIGNISNGALGAFYGYASEYRTLIIPR